MAKVKLLCIFKSHVENLKENKYVDLGLTVVNVDLNNSLNFGKL